MAERGLAPRDPSALGETIPDADLETCSHRHEILAAVIEADRGRPLPIVTLYHWQPPTVRLKCRVMLSPDVLPTIKGFTALDTYFLPKSLDRDISETFSALLTATPPSGPEITPQLLSDLIAQLPITDQGDFVQFFSFSVFSNSPNEVLADGLLPIWKWAKPNSSYNCKRGFWETNLHQALEHVEWTAGKDLILLIIGVSEQTFQTLQTIADRRTTGLASIMRLETLGYDL
ncbi:hypothetical protein QBC46DRAFT_378814 [Diplogelasinospora grovesii]|uniref:Uncharacterized protein n=1 Tax=Diplogelasinospora grovesii TaxID=303347 RepID=A0AAN6NG28_9PEZI|nr:hypothetical protein QBC46DRAFT_378814 [Diplogelasinospora grovesii]